MKRRGAIAALVPLVLALGEAACSSTKDPSLGVRVLDAVVVEREYEAPGTGNADYRGSGHWYLVFEAREGEATARYRYQVTRQQYYRYPEGSRVQIVLADNLLREIRPAPGI
ncbi:MAG TPA: hypothetical protein VLO07_03860 [Thermoanaerobaculia bacterium]|nr:hypothetical protein [Thermoanaerobaculia bacterium]